jgi:putative flippase GtrA
MIQRLIAVSIGAIVTILVLWLYDLTKFTDPMPAYAAAAVIGAIASFFWPVVIGFWLGRRARQRRQDQIDREVQRQLEERQG